MSSGVHREAAIAVLVVAEAASLPLPAGRCLLVSVDSGWWEAASLNPSVQSHLSAGVGIAMHKRQLDAQPAHRSLRQTDWGFRV